MSKTTAVIYSLMALAAAVIALFVDTVGPLPGYAGQRFMLVFFLVFLPCISLLFKPFSVFPKSVSSYYPLVGFAIFIVSGLASFFTGEANSDFGWLELVFYGLYLVAVASLARIVVISGQPVVLIKITLFIFAATCFFYALSTPAVYYYALSDGVRRLDEYIPWGFVNIRYWSHTASWLLPLLPLAALLRPFARERLWKGAVSFTAAIWWWILLMTFSRGSMLGLAMGALVVAVVFGRLSLPWLKIFAQHIALGLMVWLLLSLTIPGFLVEDTQMRSLGTSSSGRMPLWQEAWQMSLQSFPLGMGPQSWLTHEIMTEAYSQSPRFAHPHNMYLMWAAEYGWLAVMGLALVGWAGVRGLWQQRREMLQKATDKDVDSLLLVGFTASVIAGLMHAFFSAVFIAPASMLLGLFVLGCFWALVVPAAVVSNKRVERGAQAATRVIIRLTMVLLFLIPVGYWSGEVRSYYQAMQLDEVYQHRYTGGGHQPRFWYHGNFPRHPSQMPEAE